MNHLIKRITSFLMIVGLILNLGIITSYAEPDWPSDEIGRASCRERV